MATRDDHVITVYHPDGTTIVEHKDGTRITTQLKQVQVPSNTDLNDNTQNEGMLPSNRLKISFKVNLIFLVIRSKHGIIDWTILCSMKYTFIKYLTYELIADWLIY